jgi:hypothetical protein
MRQKHDDVGVGAEEQKAMNRQTWSARRSAGVGDGEPMEVETFFFAPSEASAQGLRADLAADGWATRVTTAKSGLLRRRTVWSVAASRALSGVDLAVLDDMVDRLDALADKHSAEFDGWGTEIP